MAEITYADGRKEFLEPPTAPQEIRAPTAFEQYRSARQNVIEKPLKALPGMSPGVAEAAGEFLTPQTVADQGIEIGTFGMPGASKFASKIVGPGKQLVERGIRYAAPAVGGAVGSLIGTGGDVGRAALEGGRGALYGAAGDLLPFAKGLFGHSKAIEKADEAAVGKAVEKGIPGVGKVATKQDLDAVAVRGRGQAALDEFRTSWMEGIHAELDKAREPARLASSARPDLKRLRTTKLPESIDVPSLAKVAGGGSMTVEQAKGWLDRLGAEGWSLTDQLATGMDAAQARNLRTKARKEIIGVLNKEKEGLGDTFDQGLNAMAKGHLYIDILRQPGVIADGKLNMNSLRDVMGKMANQTETYANRLSKLGSAEDVKMFYDALSRRSGDLTGRDVKGSIGIGLHSSTAAAPHLWFGLPKLPKHVGEVPPVRIGPGGTPISLGLEALSRETAGSEQR